jgi:hypothetical protein
MDEQGWQAFLQSRFTLLPLEDVVASLVVPYPRFKCAGHFCYVQCVVPSFLQLGLFAVLLFCS